MVETSLGLVSTKLIRSRRYWSETVWLPEEPAGKNLNETVVWPRKQQQFLDQLHGGIEMHFGDWGAAYVFQK